MKEQGSLCGSLIGGQGPNPKEANEGIRASVSGRNVFGQMFATVLLGSVLKPAFPLHPTGHTWMSRTLSIPTGAEVCRPLGDVQVYRQVAAIRAPLLRTFLSDILWGGKRAQ